MLTAVRAARARLDAAPLRAAIGRAAEAGPWAARSTARGVALPCGALRLDGQLKINPMSGAVFAGGHPLDLGPEARPTDWLVQAFPSRLRLKTVCPLWYGAEASERALAQEALPRAIALHRIAPEAEALISLPLGRLSCVQEAIAAGAFGTTPVRVHAWDKVIEARTIVTVPRPSKDDVEEAAK
ncbi:MAG: hypothetical protein AAFU61_11985, partial [Pseudomonadota bacterium]